MNWPPWPTHNTPTVKCAHIPVACTTCQKERPMENFYLLSISFQKMPATFMAVPLFKQSLIFLILSSSDESCVFQTPGQVQPSRWMETLLTICITPPTLHSLPCPITPFCYSRIPLCSKYLLCLSIPLGRDVPKARAMSCSSFCPGCLFPKYMCVS